MKTVLSLNSFISKILFAILTAGMFVTTVKGATLIVRSDDSGSYTTISSAITAAASGDVLDILGTFTGDGSTSSGIVINKNLTLTGHGVDSTIVQATTSAYNSAINKRVFTISAGYTVTIQNLTVRYGYISTGTNYDGGGGIKNSGILTLTNCTVTQNGTYSSSYQLGAGLLDDGSATLTVNNCTFSYNKGNGSSAWGGAMMHGNYGTPGLLTIKNSTFNNNIATGRGGALYIMILNTTPVNILTNNTFYNNQSGDYGGAIFNDRSNTIFTNNTIVGNVNTSGSGGGLSCYAYTTFLKNNLLANNKQSTSTANDLYFQSATITDNGYNLVEYSSGYTFSGTGDITGTQSSLNVDTGLTTNGVSGVPMTLGLLSGSVAINAGNSGSNSTVTVPCQDERGYYIATTKDIGAFEYNGTSTASYSINITTQPRDTTLCLSSAVTFTVATSNGTTFQWTKNGTNIAGKTSASLSFAGVAATDSGSYACIVSDNCVSATSYAAKLTMNLGPGITTTPGSHCGTGTVTLGASSTGTYNWYAASSGGSSLGTNSSYTTPSISTTTTYYVSATGGGCTSARTPVVATIGTSTPTISGTTPASVCDSGAMSLGAAASAGTVNWYAASTGGSSLGTGTSFTTPSISSTTTYYVDATNNSCTTASRTAIAATVTATPTITVTTPASRCGTGSLNLSAAASAGSVNWWAAPSGPPLINTGSSLSITASSTVTVYVDATNNGCTTASRTAVTATINSLPVASISSSGPTGFCGSNGITLYSTAGASYLWSTGETTSSIYTDTTNAYTVTVTDSNGCSATSSGVGTVSYPVPVITSTTNGSVCVSGTMDLSASASIGTISWYADAAGDTLLATGNSFTTPTISSTTTYYVNATAVCGSTMTAVTASVNALPSVTANNTASAVCSGSTVTLTGSGASSYTWDNSVTDGVAFAPSATHTYTVTGTDGNSCSATATVTVTVNSLPTVSANTTASSVCSGSTVTLTGSGASSYIWTNSATNGVAFSPSATHTYAVTGTDGNGCSATDTVTVTVNSHPTVIAHSTASTVCQGSNVTLTGSGASSYTWDGGVTNGVAFADTVAHTYTVTGTNSNGCSATATTTVNVNAAPLAYNELTYGSNVGCGSVTLNSLGLDGIASFLWNNGGTDKYNTVDTSGDYFVIVTDVNGCTATSITLSVTVNTNPSSVTVTAGSATTFCQGDSVTLTANSSESNLEWSNGNTTSSITVSAGGNYTVTATNSYGCTATSSAAVTVNAIPSITNFLGSSSCSAGAFEIGALVSAGTTSWYADSTGGSSLGTGMIFYTPTIASTTTYYVEATSNGCTSTRTAVTATINPPPSVSMSALNNVGSCNSSFALSDGSPSGGIYSGAGVSNNNFSPSVGAGTYTITYTYTDNNSCINADSTTIQVVGATAVSAGAYSTVGICNTSFALTNGAPSGGIYSGTGVSNNQFDPSVGAGAHVITYSYTDTYGCSGTDSTVVNVAGLPVVTAGLYNSVGTCNNSFNLNNGSPAGGIYSGTGVINGQFDPSIGAGTYTVLYSYTDTYGCTNSDSTSITVASNPLVTAGSYSAVGICNSPLTLTNGSPSGGVYSGTGVSNGAFDPSIGAGTYTVTYSYTNSHGCSATSQTSITVDPTPTVSAGTYSPVAICKTPVSLSDGTPSGGIYSGTGITNNTFDPSIGAGNHSITYTYTDTHGCSGNDATSIDVIPGPTVTDSSNYDICSVLAPFVLTGGVPSGGTYSGIGVSNGIFDPTTAGIGNADITYTYIDTNGCSGQASQIITVNVCTEVENINNVELFSIYPNPNRGVFTVKAQSEVTYTILNEIGQSVRKGILNLANNYMINIEDLGNGMYYLVGFDNHSSTKQKIVVTK